MWVYTLLPKILNMSLTAGVVTVLVLLVRIPLKKAPKIFSYALWAVVFFRLACPVSFSSEFSLLGVFHAPAVTNGSITYIPTDIVHTEYPRVDLPIPGIGKLINDNLPQGREQIVADPLEWQMAAATVLWLGGIAAMLIYSAASLQLLRRRLIGAVRLRENIYLADHIATPFVIGVIRPKIYLPSSLAEQEQSHILLHEQTHVRRLDHIFKMMAFLALAVHWFNPLVWVAFVSCVKDMEMSCDERVLKEMGGGIKGAYSTSLLSLATGQRLVNGSPLAFGEGSIKGRIKNVMSFKKPEFWVLIVTAAVVLVAAACLLTNPLKAQEPSDLKDGLPPNKLEPPSPSSAAESKTENTDSVKFFVTASPGRYTPAMSSTPGIRLDVTYDGPTAQILYKAETGGFITWQNSIIEDLGNSVTRRADAPALYWRPNLDTPQDDRITLTVLNEAGEKIAGSSFAIAKGDDGFFTAAAVEPWELISRAFAEAFFEKNTEVMKSYLLDPDKGFHEYNLGNGLSDVGSVKLKFNPKDIKSDSVSAQYEFKFDGDDSYTYLQLSMKKVNDMWKIESYGLEK